MERAIFWVVAPTVIHIFEFHDQFNLFFLVLFLNTLYFGTDWKMGLAVTDPFGNLLHNIVHSSGTNSAMGWITVGYTWYYDSFAMVILS